MFLGRAICVLRPLHLHHQCSLEIPEHSPTRPARSIMCAVSIVAVVLITYFQGYLVAFIPTILLAFSFFVLLLVLLLHFKGPSVQEHSKLCEALWNQDWQGLGKVVSGEQPIV